MQFEVGYTKLKNGVRVMTIPMAGVESTAVLVLVKTGSRNETEEQAGISHVLEHMVFKGTAKYPTPLSLAKEIDALGAEYNAYTGKEYTGFYIHADHKHWGKAVAILGEMITKPLIPQAELLREQGVIIEEINMYEDEPAEKASEEIENLLFGGSSLGRPIIGRKKTVSDTTPDSIKSYKDIWYRGGNVLIVVAGKIDEQEQREVLTQLEANFGGLPGGELMPFATKGAYGQERFFHLQKKTEQAHFAMALPGYDMHNPKRYSALMLSTILGGTMSSRLFTEVREKLGLAYYVGARHEAMADVGQVVIRAGVRLEKLEEAMEVVKKEVMKIATDVTAQELQLAKDNIAGRMILTLSDPMGVAQYFGQRTLITNTVLPVPKTLQALASITKQELIAIAKDLFVAEELRTVVVGPVSG